MNRKFKIFKKLFALIMTILPLIILTSVKAAGDTSGEISVNSSGCSGKDSCWLGFGSGEQLFGIRVTMVDGNGNMVSARSMDYIGNGKSTVNFINNKKIYYRCVNNNRNKLSYLNKSAKCTWDKHDGKTVIAKYWKSLPNIFDDDNAASTIKKTILNMDEKQLNDLFFKDIGYTLTKTNIQNHYLIIEPLTYVSLGKSGKQYYGTYYELAPKILDYDWVYSVGTIRLPQSIYITGNTEIKGPGGYNSKSETYFNGLLQIANMKKHTYKDSRGRKKLYSAYVKDQSYGYGIGIYWLNQFTNIETESCDYNNAEHFATNNSGPNGENCCNIIKNNLSSYGITEAQFYTKYPQCNEKLKNCTFDLSTKYPVCGTDVNGEISDITDWECIYASAYSNDTDTKNYFLAYGKPTDTCSVYCRNEITYTYPSDGMITLAGTYFTIDSATNSYRTHTNTVNFKNATLGPVKISVTKECSILGDKNNATCKTKLNEQLNSIQAPSVEFAYESKYYNNPKETLISTSEAKSSTKNDIHSRTVTYTYSLPNNTYKYVSKNNGISYKTISQVGDKPYLEIGSHMPIHFTQTKLEKDYQLTIKKFNLTNFDNLILNGKTMSTKFTTSIETYIKTLIDNGKVKPVYINGLYYLNNTFIELLKKNNYTVNELLNSPCGNTNNYTCYSNANGIYCYDKDKNTNTENTYVLFNTCINNEVTKLKSKNASYKNDLLYKCNFEIDLIPKIPGEDDNPDTPTPTPTIKNGIDVIFRTIDLDDPFPSIDANGRITGSNWCAGPEDCSNVNAVVDSVIINNRGVKTEELYKELDPLYKITLTPAIIKEIRKYNNTTRYDDFNLVCDANKDNCKSDFIRTTLDNNKYNFSKFFTGCGISNKSSGLDCQEYDKW